LNGDSETLFESFRGVVYCPVEAKRVVGGFWILSGGETGEGDNMFERLASLVLMVFKLVIVSLVDIFS
jgi:hypothetical protein